MLTINSSEYTLSDTAYRQVGGGDLTGERLGRLWQCQQQHPSKLNWNILFLCPWRQTFGDNTSNQGGQYPSPYQARYRLHSKHGNRSYKRRANASAGGDGVSSAFGGSGSGTGLGSAAGSRGRTERDRFLVDINSGGQRSGAAANPLLNARKNVGQV